MTTATNDTRAALPIAWRVGHVRLSLTLAIHGVAVAAAVDIATTWSGAWWFVCAIMLSAVFDVRGWSRERRYVRVLRPIRLGLAIDSQDYRARRAWLGPGCTAVWLANRNTRRLLYVMCGEVTPTEHAALRRHVKSLEYA